MPLSFVLHVAIGFLSASVAESVRTTGEQGTFGGVICPDQCQDCCAASWAKTPLLNFGTSDKKFKCILKVGYHNVSHGDIPPDRSCTEPERRTTSSSQAKIECDYSQAEIADEAWEKISSTCSKVTRCCCDAKDDWTEKLCFGMATEGESVHAVSPKSKVEEKYVLVDQRYQNKYTPCEGPENKAVSYQDGSKTPFQSTGCCLETVEKTESETYRCGHTCKTSGYPARSSCTHKSCHRTLRWTACAKWEELFHCSDDGGLTQSGLRFHRVSDNPGECMGEHLGMHPRLKLTEENKCPDGYADKVTGRKCQCPTACG